MKKLVQILSVVNFVFAAVVLALGCMLFARRELLKGRTQVLEDNIIQLTAYIENEPGAINAPAGDPAKDIGECEADLFAAEELERSDFWETYNYNLEVQDPRSMVTLDRNQLTTYYLRDPFSDAIARDNQGRRVIEGPGTMQAVLKDLQEKAEAQYGRLSDTREQLKNIRSELAGTITELNDRKQFLRGRLVHIEKLDGDIQTRDMKIAGLKEENTGLEQQIYDQKIDIANAVRQRDFLAEEIVENKEDIARLKERIKELEGKEPGETIDPDKITQTDKGIVKGVDLDYRFVTVALDDAFMKELFGEQLDGKMPVGFELYIDRQNGERKFVTKVALKNVFKENKLGIFNILPGWDQMLVKEGDILHFQR